MLPEVVELKRNPRKLPSPGKVVGWRPPQEAAPTWLRLRPPKRLFGLVNDIAPRQSDVVQVAIGPLGQFAPLALPVAPNMEGLVELSEKARLMMICHRFM
jgi:hypothetical protein